MRTEHCCEGAGFVKPTKAQLQPTLALPPLLSTKRVAIERTIGRLGKSVKFNLIDKIEALSDERIVAVKFVSLAEEYLADHFPRFPVLPGVMMLEAMTQAAGWLLHHRTGFAKTMSVLKEARNVKYGNFVAPGNALKVEVTVIKATEAGGTFKVAGTVHDTTALSGRIELAYFNLGEKHASLAYLDEQVMAQTKKRWELLQQSSEITIDLPSVSAK
jgi:3-hydroxyacyl-[acyl-carrier-protein] dehydratase